MLNVKNMTPEQKLGHVLCSCLVYDIEGNFEFVLDLIKKKACSFIRIGARKRNLAKIKQLREAADYPLVIVTDMETGYAPSGRELIPMLSLSACDNSEYTKAFAAAIARDAKADGFSGCWSPIVDILYGDGPASVSRKSGDSIERVTRFARDVSEVFKSYNFQSTGKHYPGGAYDIAMDTHMVEGVCSKTEEELLNSDLVPYFELWRDGLLPSIMTRHCVYPNIDPNYPASLSKKMINIMRSRGYDGLIYTDSLAMMGILQKYGEKEAYALAIEAGNDVILPNIRRSNKEIFEMLVEAYNEGLISDARLNESAERAIKYAAKYAEPAHNPYPVPDNINEILDSISRDSVTALCDDGVSPDISKDGKRLFIVMTDQGYKGVEQEISLGGWYSPKRVIDAIKSRFENAEIECLSEYADAVDNERVLYAASHHKEVVFVTFCTTGAYLGTDCLTRRAEAVINAIAMSGKLSTIVHFGNPLALNNIKHVGRRIFGYLAPKAQAYAFDVLAGNIEPKGKNPFPSLLK